MAQLISNQPIGPNDQVAVVTTYQGAGSLRIHAMGFLEIATVAARAALDHRTAIDAVIPSIIYAMRHAAELFVKHIVAELADKHGITVPPPKRRDLHNIKEWFDAGRAQIQECLDYEAEHDEHGDFDRRAWLVELGDIIKQLHAVDPDGQTLRYPANIAGAPNLGGTMPVSVAQLEQFARHATGCFLRFSQRCG